MQIHKILLCALLIGCFTAGAAEEPPNKKDDSEPNQLDKDILQVFMPGPRDLRQKISRAERAIAEEDYSYAVSELAQVFSAPEDFFLNPHEPEPRSMKQVAHKLLGSMPPRGREFYQIQFGPDARAMLDEALAEGDIGKLAEVPRTYFHTEAGYKATILLGRYHLDQGRPLAGAMCLKRIADTPGAGKDHEPHLSILLATCWLYADMPEKAQQTLESLKQRLPRAFISVGGQDVKLFDRPEEALAWMQRLVGSPTFGSSLAATEWTMFRGSETRNAESAGGIPIANPRWRVPVLNEPRDEQLATQLQKQYVDQRLPALPAMHSLAVDNWVLMRTPKGLIGVDFETGKRVWEYPWGKQYSLPSRSSGAQSRGDEARRNELNQRLWEDAAYGQVSSDGKSIYLIDEMGYALQGSMSGRVIVAPNGIRHDNPNYPRDYNVLTALALRDEKGAQVEGKIRWKVGGAAGWEEPALAGAFFLGPPLTLLGQLYVLVEMNGQIELKVLDAKTGKLQWSQQLAHLEANSDPEGRTAALGWSVAFVRGRRHGLSDVVQRRGRGRPFHAVAALGLPIQAHQRDSRQPRFRQQVQSPTKADWRALV